MWIRGIDPETIAETLGEDAHTAGVRVLDRFDEGALVEVEWTAATGENGLPGALAAHDVAVLRQTGTKRGWQFRLRFPDTNSTQAFQRACHEAGVSLSIDRVIETSETAGVTDRLTDAQREVFRLALERGYFDIPRRTTLVDIAEELGISDQAVSERLRRGQTKIGQAAMRSEL